MSKPDDEHPLGDLTPEAFHGSSAREIHEHPVAMTNLGLHRGEVGFRLFVDLLRHECRMKLVLDDEFESFAVLSSVTTQRRFLGEGDEFPDDFANRLRREARDMNATWLFVAMLSPFRVRAADADHPEIDLDDTEGIDAAIARGDLATGLIWSASQREDKISNYLGGVIHLDEVGFPGREITGKMNPDTDTFSTVLDR